MNRAKSEQQTSRRSSLWAVEILFLLGTLLSAQSVEVVGPEGAALLPLETRAIGGVTYCSATALRALLDGQRTPFRAQYRYTAPTGSVSLRVLGPQTEATLRMRIGSRSAELLGGGTVELAAPPLVREGEVWFPIQLLSELLPQLMGFSATYEVANDRLLLDWTQAVPPLVQLPEEAEPLPIPPRLELPFRSIPPAPARWVNLRPVLDPGHGGGDPGVQGNGLIEKELTLALARQIASIGTAMGVRCVLTRNGDQERTLQERLEAIERSNGTVLLSLHFNRSPSPSESGYRVVVPTLPPRGGRQIVPPAGIEATGGRDPFLESQRLAELIAQSLSEAGFVGKVLRLPVALLHRSPVPAVHVELGYLSNAQEAQYWSDSRTVQRAAEALWAALARYLPSGEGR
ncbi:MAG: hypothetical protein KatS3mg115_1868 [Candidatus Poribacteria bacterium]|nr:MAG: hypothetical protein KatS3mg115_1868 [Candidatus Poribacteria bacterium]